MTNPGYTMAGLDAAIARFSRNPRLGAGDMATVPAMLRHLKALLERLKSGDMVEAPPRAELDRAVAAILERADEIDRDPGASVRLVDVRNMLCFMRDREIGRGDVECVRRGAFCDALEALGSVPAEAARPELSRDLVARGEPSRLAFAEETVQACIDLASDGNCAFCAMANGKHDPDCWFGKRLEAGALPSASRERGGK